MMRHSKHGKLILFLMIFIVASPFVFAWSLVQKTNKVRLRTHHHGELISPLINLSQLQITDHHHQPKLAQQLLAHKWSILYLPPPHCEQSCLDQLHELQQLQRALGKDAHRLQRFVILPPGTPDPQYADMSFSFSAHDFAALFANQEKLFIVDPQGNLMMSYAPHTPGRAILSDLKRLLRISKIG